MTNTIEELLQKYPNMDINRSGGSDAFQEGLPIVERDPVAVIIKHPAEDKYLISQWHTSNWNGFLTGGIEDGEDFETAVRREIEEETGYTDVVKIVRTDCVSHGLFFHTIKNVNRLAHYHLVVAILGSLAQIEVSEEEKKIATFAWFDEAQVHDLLTRDDMKILWKYFEERKEGLVI